MFEEIGVRLERPLNIYVIGGGAMAFRGDKDSTKDLDLVVLSDEDGIMLTSVTKSIGYRVNERIPPECRSLTDAVILTASSGERVDIFTSKICGRLTFNESMAARSEMLLRSGNALVWLASREDIFLLKSVTERDKDLDDMLALFLRGLDGKTIMKECGTQSGTQIESEEPIFEAFLAVKLEELEAYGGIQIPWRGKIQKEAEAKVLRAVILRIANTDNFNAEDLSRLTEMRHAAVMKELRELVRDGLIYLDDEGIMHRRHPSRSRH
jgi:hypothetical protein